MIRRIGCTVFSVAACLLAAQITYATPPQPGDIDGDCDIDFADSTAFVAVLLGVDADLDHVTRADINGDGWRDAADIQLFTEALIDAPPGGPVIECVSVNTPFTTIAYCGGAEYVSNTSPVGGPAFSTLGLVALDLPNTVVVEGGGVFYISEDSGCTWRPLASLAQGEMWPMVLERAADGGAYAWSLIDDTLYQLQASGGSGGQRCCPPAPVSALPRPSPVPEILGLGTDPTDPQHVVLADDDGQLYESTNGGQNWSAIGVAPPAGSPLTYRMAFDPSDPIHAIFGRALDGAWVTFDGGATWTHSKGFSETGGSANVFNMVVSPVDSNVVWAMGVDVDQQTAGHPSAGRHIYLSANGGLDFLPVLDQSTGVIINNGPVLTPHPTNVHVVSFVFNSIFSGAHLYRYDASTDHVITFDHPQIGMRMIEYSRDDPSIVYFGLDYFPGG